MALAIISCRLLAINYINIASEQFLTTVTYIEFSQCGTQALKADSSLFVLESLETLIDCCVSERPDAMVALGQTKISNDLRR